MRNYLSITLDFRRHILKGDLSRSLWLASAFSRPFLFSPQFFSLKKTFVIFFLKKNFFCTDFILKTHHFRELRGVFILTRSLHILSFFVFLLSFSRSILLTHPSHNRDRWLQLKSHKSSKELHKNGSREKKNSKFFFCLSLAFSFISILSLVCVHWDLRFCSWFFFLFLWSLFVSVKMKAIFFFNRLLHIFQFIIEKFPKALVRLIINILKDRHWIGTIGVFLCYS